MRPPQPTGFIEMRIRSFEILTPSTRQGQPTHASDASTIRVHRGARRRLVRPVAPAAIGLRDIGPQVECHEIHQRLITVVSLVGHDLVDDRRVPVGRHRHGFELFDRRGDRLRDRRRIALIGALHRHAHDRPSLQVDGVLSLVGQMRTPVLHFRDPRIRVVWMPPVGIAALLRAPAIKAR